MNETPEIMIMGGVVVKYVIDIFSPLIPEQARKYIPILALAMWLWRAFFFFDAELAQQIYIGITTWAWAVWVNELAKIFDKKKA